MASQRRCSAECLSKKAQLETHTCFSCKATLPREAFPESMWDNRNHHDQNAYCNDCCRPKCTRKKCKTCKTCRREGCPKKSKCELRSLHWKQLPKTLAERDAWLCRECRAATCQNCKKDMPPSTKQRRKKAGTEQPWTCGDCLIVEESKNVHRKCT